jgi:hypothetical protein
MPLAIPIPRLVVRSTRLICSSIRWARSSLLFLSVVRCLVGVVIGMSTDPMGGYRSQQRDAWVLWQIERPGVVIAFG